MIIWRLTTKDNISEAFDGEGASRYGGRWNSKGRKMVYCSESVSLAVLENLVHFDVDIAPPLYLYEIEIDDPAIDRDSTLLKLLRDKTKSKHFGDKWISSKSNMALEVPSAVVERENNFLLNPEHSSFSSLKITSHGLFYLDSRLTK